MYDLEPETRARHLAELCDVAAALDTVFAPTKMNIESLGNGIPHLHWWLTPRHPDDARLSAPIWENHDFVREMRTESGFADPEVLADDAERLRREIARRGLVP